MAASERASKRAKILDDESSGSSDEAAPSGLTNGFGINEQYAKRFEHNKKREERQRLEEKYGKSSGSSSLKRSRDDEEDENEEDDSSEDESEDDDAEFATKDVDDEIMATLNAIRSKDPRVYNKDIKFYKEFEAPTQGAKDDNKEKPLYLQDYHRQNLLAGHNGDQFENSAEPQFQTYQVEQDQMRRDLVGSMHAAAAVDDNKEDDSDEDNFLVTKSKPKHDAVPSTTRGPQITDRDVADAEKDPETYLSNFMAARAWLPQQGSRWEAFESDDSEDEDRADKFEGAYNMRFEDPATANEKLQSFARDVGKYSVRRDEKSGRKRAREREQEKKDAERRERDEERARLRKLKIEEAEEKLQKIKDAAGMSGKTVRLEDWRDVIEGDFDDDQWEEAMRRRFDDQYYADEDGAEVQEDDGAAEADHKRKIKKPKWNDDIDINDIVPDFGEDDGNPEFTLSDEEQDGVDDDDGGVPIDGSEEEGNQQRKKPKTKKDRAKEKSEAKRAARFERRQLEEMVDSALPLSHAALASSSAPSKAPVAGFRYRETSPTSFGLSARDILFANDSQLNEFAGLKKLASFRDDDKKRRDKKKLSKKARLKQWRRDTFGNPDAPTGGFERLLGKQGHYTQPEPPAAKDAETGIIEGERKKKRSRKGKKAAAAPA